MLEWNRQHTPTPSLHNRRFRQSIHIIITTFNEHIRPQRRDQLNWRLLTETNNIINALKRGQQSHPISLVIDRPIIAFTEHPN